MRKFRTAYKCGISLLILMITGICLKLFFTEDRKIADEILNSSVADLVMFGMLMGSLTIQHILIDPLFLYEMLDDKKKDLLARRQFQLSGLAGSPRVVTFAFLEDKNISVNSKLQSGLSSVTRHFRYWQVKKKLKSDDWLKEIYRNSFSVASHHFFAGKHLLIHGVVFFKRKNYLWHAGLEEFLLPPGVELSLSKKDMLFSEDSSYERFSVVHGTGGAGGRLFFYVPSDISYFLLQIPSSTFLECDLSRASSVKKGNLAKNSRYKKLKKVFLESLNEFKVQLQPELRTIFIFAGTLLGWYRQCDIIPYTSDVDFAGWASHIGEEAFWTTTFRNNSHLKIKELMGMPEEAFELSFRTKGYKVDLFFIYENETLSWAYGHRPKKGYYFSYSYPKFKLCSGDLLEHRVQVPCTAEEVIAAEYGPNWRTPASSWYYERSPKNMGPRVYWPEEVRKNVSKYFN